jgi:predicted RecA/RadA family phage recombinase
MQNFIQEGTVLTLVAPRALTSGEGFLVGSQFAVATSASLISVDVEGLTEGVVSLPKTSAQAWTQGQKIYWDNTNFRCDSTSTIGILIGVATEVAANPSSTGVVKLCDCPPEMLTGTVATIAALTDSTGAGAADSTLADGLTSVAPDAFTAPIAGAVTVTSNAATDLSGIVAPAVANLRGVVATLVTDVTTANQNVADLGAKVNAILVALKAVGIVA